MGIQGQLRKLALGVACSSVLAGVGMAAPGSALATVKCDPLAGTGSSLQKVQQELWMKEAEKVTLKVGTENCEKEVKPIEYNPAGSGKGLKEFGLEEPFELLPQEGLLLEGDLDGFIGTDDPPTHAQILKAEEKVAKHAETKAIAVPVLAAPVALLAHLPSGCTISAGVPEVTQVDIELLLKKTITWTTLLETDGKATLSGGAACNVVLSVLEVRSDNSGTSYAFKQWMCQILGENNGWGKAKEKCEEEAEPEVINDSKKWPSGIVTTSETHGGVNNEKGPGEVKAVCETANSFGYANAADAAAAANCTTPFGEAKANSSLFWLKVENGEKSGESKIFEEPASGKKANCPENFTVNNTGEAKKGEWAKEHFALGIDLGSKKIEKYPVCTFTYDVGWENYLTPSLIESTSHHYLSKELAGEIGNSVIGYFTWEIGIGTTPKEGQKLLAEYYAPLPTSVQLIAAEDVALIKS